MSEALALTVYFGERSRTQGRLVADELLELFGRRRLHASVLLRGAQGFGAKHRLRTDRLLTLSEDLPAVAIAVDARPAIESLIGEVKPLVPSGLLTLEGVEMVTVPGRATDLKSGDPRDALKLTVYLGRHERLNGEPAFAAICRMLYEDRLDGATVLLGVDGTRHGHRRRARFLARNAHVPTVVLAVGAPEPMRSALDRIQRALPTALLTTERVLVCKRDGALMARPDEHLEPTSPSAGGEPLQRLTVVTSEAATHAGRPLHIELVERLRRAGAAGATSLRGVWGFHGDHEPHGEKLLSLRRHVPIVTAVVDTPLRVAALFPIVDEMTAERGLVTSEVVPANIALSARL